MKFQLAHEDSLPWIGMMPQIGWNTTFDLQYLPLQEGKIKYRDTTNINRNDRPHFTITGG
jgi:hypothetical protein